MEYKKGQLLYEGKTKKVYETDPVSDFLIIENKEDITAYDNPKFTKKFSSKAAFATTTTCRVFELLKTAGLPVAYEKQLSTTEFLTPKCQMIPLEAVPRRYAVGSYLKRHPDMAATKIPHRFHRLVTEFFLKTTDGRLERNGKILVEGLDKLNGEEVCKVIRNDPVFSKTPVIMVTGKATDVDRIVGRVIGADIYITKPFDLKHLLSALKKVL